MPGDCSLEPNKPKSICTNKLNSNSDSFYNISLDQNLNQRNGNGEGFTSSESAFEIEDDEL